MVPHIFDFERRLPAWIAPTCRGAVCMFGLGIGVAGKLYVAALVAALMLMLGPGNGVFLFLAIVGVTMVAGAVGGAIHGLLRPLGQHSRLGAGVGWFAALLGAFAVSVLLTPTGPFSLDDPTAWLIAAGCAALAAGTLVLADDRRPGRLTPHQYRWLRRHDRRWATMRRPGSSGLTRGRIKPPATSRWLGLSRPVRWWRARRRPVEPAMAIRPSGS